MDDLQPVSLHARQFLYQAVGPANLQPVRTRLGPQPEVEPVVALRKERTVVEADLLRLLRVDGPQRDARADSLRIAPLPDESQFQPMIAVVGQIAIGLQIPREPVLRVFAQLLPPPPLREILERSQQQIAPSVVVEIGPVS